MDIAVAAINFEFLIHVKLADLYRCARATSAMQKAPAP
jgi:hypothetical protein